MSNEERLKQAKTIFKWHIEINEKNKKMSTIDSLDFASRIAGINIFILSKELDLYKYKKR